MKEQSINPLVQSGDPPNNFLSVLTKPTFLSFSLSVIFSQIGFNMMNVSLIFLIYKITTSNFSVSLLVLSFLLPQLFFSFLGGIIGDAKNKRKILITGNLIRAFALLMLFFFHNSLGALYLTAIVVSVVTQFYVPAETPMIPHLVRKGQLLTANAIFGVCLFGSILVGYIFAGIALHYLGASGAILITSIMFFGAAICIMLLPNIVPSTRKLRIPGGIIANVSHLYKLSWKEFVLCLEIIKKKRNAADSLIFLALSQVIILVLATIVPGYARTTLGILPEDTSIYIFAPAGVGMILSALIIGSLFSQKSKQFIMNTGILLSSIVLLFFSAVDFQNKLNVLHATILITFFAGVANSCIFVPAQTIIQTDIADEYRSKIYGLLYAVVGAIALLPIILAGLFADVLGVRAVLIGISVLLLAIGLWNIFFYKK